MGLEGMIDRRDFMKAGALFLPATALAGASFPPRKNRDLEKSVEEVFGTYRDVYKKIQTESRLPGKEFCEKDRPFLTWIGRQYGVDETFNRYREIGEDYLDMGAPYRIEDKDRIFLTWLNFEYGGREMKMYEKIIDMNMDPKTPSDKVIEYPALATGFILKNGFSAYWRTKKRYPENLKEMLFDGSFSKHMASSSAWRYLPKIRKIYGKAIEKYIKKNHWNGKPEEFLFSEKYDRMMAGQFSRWGFKSVKSYLSLIERVDDNDLRAYLSLLKNRFNGNAMKAFEMMSESFQKEGIKDTREIAETTSIALQDLEAKNMRIKRYPIFFRFDRW